jgi:hypothetical protein
MATSQYQISKARKDLKRLRAELVMAKAKQSDLTARGLRGSAEEAGGRIHVLQESVDQTIVWLEANAPEKFIEWSPARLRRHQQRHSA